MYYDVNGNTLSAEEYHLLVNNAINYIVSIYDEVCMNNSGLQVEYEEVKQYILSDLITLRDCIVSENGM